LKGEKRESGKEGLISPARTPVGKKQGTSFCAFCREEKEKKKKTSWKERDKRKKKRQKKELPCVQEHH